MSRDDFTSTVDGAAAYEAEHGRDDYEPDRPDLDERPVGTGGRVFGPNDHICHLHPRSCHVCARDGVYGELVSWEERQLRERNTR